MTPISLQDHFTDFIDDKENHSIPHTSNLSTGSLPALNINDKPEKPKENHVFTDTIDEIEGIHCIPHTSSNLSTRSLPALSYSKHDIINEIPDMPTLASSPSQVFNLPVSTFQPTVSSEDHSLDFSTQFPENKQSDQDDKQNDSETFIDNLPEKNIPTCFMVK